MSALRNVLCPIDFSPLTERTLELAVPLCLRTGARLVLEHNLDPRPPGFLTVSWMWSEVHGESQELEPAEAQVRLQRLLNELGTRLDCEAKLTRGPIDRSLFYLAEKLPADLLLFASHGRGGAAHRSLAERLAVEAPVPFLLIGDEQARGVERLAAALDGDRPVRLLIPVERGEPVEGLLAYATEMARSLPLSAAVVELDPDATDAGWDSHPHPAEGETAARLRALVPSRLLAAASLHTARAAGSEVVHEIARALEAEMILVATGKRRHHRWRGRPVDRELLHDGPCPLWVVPEAAMARSTAETVAGRASA